jgi:hypothetical protein
VTLRRHEERALVQVEVAEWRGQVTIASQTWSPAQVFGSADERTLGVAVHWFRLLDS